jgi:hypothetical protein
MTRVILDSATISKLHNLSQSLQLCDETGKVRAKLVPVIDPSDYEPVPPPEMSAEELKKCFESKRWHTTAEVLAVLEKL